MAEKRHRIQCELHGGYFYRAPKRGRTPTRCGGNNDMCDANPEQPEMIRQGARQPAQSSVKPPKPGNASLSKGKTAKELLEAQGWIVAGKAWASEDKLNGGQYRYWSSITASRGEETILMVWCDGVLKESKYSLWNADKPHLNGKPSSKLPFDPDEIPDSALAQYLVGTRVTWWNKLGQREESAICGKDSIEIVHQYNGVGDETPGTRMIKFVDATGRGFHAFRLDALMAVGL